MPKILFVPCRYPHLLQLDYSTSIRFANRALIFANILKGPLVALSPEIAANLRVGGQAILSGILNEQADDVISVYLQNGFNLARRDEIGEWTTLILERVGFDRIDVFTRQFEAAFAKHNAFNLSGEFNLTRHALSKQGGN